jgi:anti-sigma regulatory factor (Ser/Thr protein kinase)
MSVIPMSTDFEIGPGTVVDLELPSVLESVPYARDLVACRVPAALRRNVELVVSELVTNAIKHGSGPVGLRVDTDGTRVHVAVRDARPGLANSAGDGYGLRIVDQLAAANGVERDADGKTLWAELYV